MIDEDADLRTVLSTMEPATRTELKGMALDDDPGVFYRALALRPDLAALRHQLADSLSDGMARHRVVRAISDVGSSDNRSPKL